jgi:hypothetical protein
MKKSKLTKQVSPRSDLCSYLQCSKCKLAYAINNADRASSLLVGFLPCTTSGCRGRLKKTNCVVVSARLIDAGDLYVALGGGGLPEERSLADPKHVKLLFEGRKILALELEHASGMRSFIRSITLDNGVVMHLAASTQGATIFKVTGGG